MVDSVGASNSTLAAWRRIFRRYSVGVAWCQLRNPASRLRKLTPTRAAIVLAETSAPPVRNQCSASRTIRGDPRPAAGGLSVPRQGEVCGCIRRGRRSRNGVVHGRLAGPVGRRSFGRTISEPAWKTKPSWYLVVTDDKMIPPPAQRLMAQRAGSTVAEVKGSHAIYVSKPEAVAALIEKAAKGVRSAVN